MNYLVTALIFAVSIVMVIFGAQNTQNVELNFLTYRSGNVPLSLVIVLATLGGALIVGLISLLNSLRRTYRERGVRKKLERENRELQTKVASLEREMTTLSVSLKAQSRSVATAAAPPASDVKPSIK